MVSATFTKRRTAGGFLERDHGTQMQGTVWVTQSAFQHQDLILFTHPELFKAPQGRQMLNRLKKECSGKSECWFIDTQE